MVVFLMYYVVATHGYGVSNCRRLREVERTNKSIMAGMRSMEEEAVAIHNGRCHCCLRTAADKSTKVRNTETPQ
jgi:hypothetical protein